MFTENFGDFKPREHNIMRSPIARTVFEPQVGGHIVDIAEDGSECRWARVLAYEPHDRVVFSWDIGPDWQLVADPDNASEVEVRFLAESPDRTRLELEHRHLDRHGQGSEAVRDGIADDAGWPALPGPVRRPVHRGPLTCRRSWPPPRSTGRQGTPSGRSDVGGDRETSVRLVHPHRHHEGGDGGDGGRGPDRGVQAERGRRQPRPGPRRPHSPGRAIRGTRPPPVRARPGGQRRRPPPAAWGRPSRSRLRAERCPVAHPANPSEAAMTTSAATWVAMSGGDEVLASDAVGQGAGDQLAGTPHPRVQGEQQTDLAHRQVGGGEQQREEPPRQAEGEVVDQPGLARRGQRGLPVGSSGRRTCRSVRPPCRWSWLPSARGLCCAASSRA